MTETWQITCVTRIERSNPYERIERAGGPEGEGWTLGVNEIVCHIKNGARFWVDVGGQRSDIVIASLFGREYIKAQVDGDTPASLLSLPECVD